jgi:hypothetical protein
LGSGGLNDLVVVGLEGLDEGLFESSAEAVQGGLLGVVAG